MGNLEILGVLWLAGWVVSVFLMWRDNRFQVNLPFHEPGDWQNTLATWYARVFLSAGWPVLMYIEALIQRRKES